MPFLPRISSSISEPWVAWTMLFLLITLLFAETLQRGILLNSFRNLRSRQERDFNTVLVNPLGQIFLYVYKVGIFALMVYALLNHGDFSFLHFLLIAALVIGFYLFKYLMARLLGYVFFTPRIFEAVLHHYIGLTTCCTVLLYPILLLILFLPSMGKIPMLILCGTLFLFFFIVLLMKIFQFFFTRPLASVHIFLYLCTLEALPLIALFYMGSRLIS